MRAMHGYARIDQKYEALKAQKQRSTENTEAHKPTSPEAQPPQRFGEPQPHTQAPVISNQQLASLPSTTMRQCHYIHVKENSEDARYEWNLRRLDKIDRSDGYSAP